MPSHLSHHSIPLPSPSPLSRASHASCSLSPSHILLFGGEDVHYKQMNDLMELKVRHDNDAMDVDETADMSQSQHRTSSAIMDINSTLPCGAHGSVSHASALSWHWRRIDAAPRDEAPQHFPTDNMHYMREEMRKVIQVHRNEQVQQYFESDGSGFVREAWSDAMQSVPVQRKFHQIVYDASYNCLWLFAGESRVPDPLSTKYMSLADLWSFDMERRQWRQYHCVLTNTRSVMARPNEEYRINFKPLYGHSLNIIGRKLYCFGGCSEGGIMRPNEMTNRLCVLDLDSALDYDDFTGDWLAKWKLVHPYVPRGMQTVGHLRAGAAALESIIKCADLRQLDETSMRDTPLREATSDEKPMGRFGHTTNVWRDRFLVVLGGNERSDIWVYDTETEVWFEVEALHGTKHDTSPGSSPSTPHRESTGAIVFHTATNYDIPLGRKFHSACIIHDDLFMFGGDCRTHLRDQVCTVFKFSLRTRLWSRITPHDSFMHCPLPRMYHSMHHVYDKSRLTDCLVLMGGYEGVSSDVTRRIDVFELDAWEARLRATLWHELRDWFCDCEVIVQDSS